MASSRRGVVGIDEGTSRTGAAFRFALGRSDLFLAAGVVATVAMMIVPLPTWLLDVLLSLNLGLAVVLLTSSLYVAGVSSLTTLPSILLLATLFRLSLNVSSTRLILVQADAGSVIRSFGSFVVAGNTLVGAVVFLILTVIQFVVIAKGSERIAEVAARFSLDAMPGRQLAIDADLRAGLLNAEAAAARRAELQRESRLYGAMDGAMKFVKGDAIAGLVITGINIVGGLAIGLWQRDMSLAEAAQTYTLLTVGDGLVSQIPALVIATAAGIVVTRVSGPGAHPLGRDIAHQILDHPKALAVAAVLLLGLAAVPGLPLLPFLMMAVLSGGASLVAWRTRSSISARAGGSARELEVVVGDVPDRPEIVAAVQDAIGQVCEEWGVTLGRPRSRMGSGSEITLLIREVPVSLGEEDRRSAEAVTAATRSALEANMAELLGLQAVRDLLERTRLDQPAAVDAALSRASLGQVRAVLVNLLTEAIPIRSMVTILEAVADGPKDEEAAARTTRVRRALRRQISHRYAPDGKLKPLLVEREVEDMLAARMAKRSPLPRDLRAEVDAAVIEAARGVPGELVILTRSEIRRAVGAMVRRALQGRRAVILAVDELEPAIEVDPAGTISVRRQ